MNQSEQILEHLKRYGTITPLQALLDYGCFRLAPRIFELREAGHGIETHMIRRRGKRFSEYRYHFDRGGAKP